MHARTCLREYAILLALLSSGMVCPAPVAALEPVRITRQLSGEHIGRRVEVLEDATGALTLEQVLRPEYSRQFVPSQTDTPNMGLSRSAYWLRFMVANRSTERAHWLLEIAYPPLDDIRLYTPAADGRFEMRQTGDHLPFARRDLPYRTFIFDLTEPSGSHVYYIRVQTSGSVTLPMRAWTQRHFFEHVTIEQPLLWVFFGLMMAMVIYNFFIYISVRDGAYLSYVFYITSFVCFQVSLTGAAYQYLWPNAVWLNGKALVLSIGSAFGFGLLFQQQFLDSGESFPRIERYYKVAIIVTFMLTAASPFVDYSLAIRTLVGWGVHVIVLGLTASAMIAAAGSRPAKFYLAAWLCLLIGILLYLLQTLGINHGARLHQWELQLGAAIEATLLSLGLADRINVMRAGLQQLNKRLTKNVTDLSDALGQAQTATKAKSVFVASVTHELRTPLNAIINIPEGLLEEFPHGPVVVCSGCHTRFELDPGEVLDATLACPECKAQHTLSSVVAWRYIGQPERTARQLKNVHRVSKHLLDVVNSILDFSRLEAGRTELDLSDIELGSVVENTVAPLSELAASKGLQLVLPEHAAGHDGHHVRADRVRVGQILVNLVGNALRFSDKAGVIKVEIVDEAESCILRVSDQGIGIAAADCTRIFESFTQVDSSNTRKFGGTGLGLAITKNLVDLHGGEIWVDSELGLGSTFSVRLLKAGPVPAALMPAMDPQAMPVTSDHPSLLSQNVRQT